MHTIWYKSFKESRSRGNDPGKELSMQEEDALSDRWGAELAPLPFEETIETFVSAAYEWLLTCDLSSWGRDEQGDEEEVMRAKLRNWATGLGVD